MSQQNIITYKMKLEVDSPLHIGGADYKCHLKTTEYVYDNRRLSIIDGAKWTDYLIRKGLFDQYVDTVRRNVSRNSKTSIADFLNRNRMWQDLAQFTKKAYRVNFDSKNDRLNDIHLTLRDAQDKPYIPGSSIKGSLLNTMLVEYLLAHPNEFAAEKQQILRLARAANNDKAVKNARNEIKGIVKKIQDSILYPGQRNPKIKRFGLSVSDTYRSENLRMAFLQDLDYNREKQDAKPMPLAREYIIPGSTFYFDITLDLDMLNRSRLKVTDMDDLLSLTEDASVHLTADTLLLKEERDIILGANTGYHQKTIMHALFPGERELLDVSRKMIHKGVNNKMGNHLQDKFAPRVVNMVHYDGQNMLAGLVYLSEV